MESRDTMRVLPTLQLFRLPSRQSCATRAVLTPSISAASAAVTAGAVAERGIAEGREVYCVIKAVQVRVVAQRG